MNAVMMNARQIAAMKGEITYINNKPCKHGHEAVRYTSTGQCKACVTGKVEQYRNIARSTRLHDAALRADGMTQTSIFIWNDHREIVNRIQAILAHRGQRAGELAAFVTMIGTATLTRDDLCRYFELDPQDRVLNFKEFDHRTGDSGQSETCIRGEWYNDRELKKLIDHQVKWVEAIAQPKPARKFLNPITNEVISSEVQPPAPPVYDGPDTSLTDADREFFRRDRELYGDD